jgi:adenylate cyclase
MASIIPGYEYDIFISYRKRDNKHDGWVTEFVDNLKGELESTFKEEISVYFDINPYDGLLETYDVDASLKQKLNCLIFIPIISQTYCDPRSFAWMNELCFFNDLAKDDRFGRDIRIAGGNVASRILPVKIHDLDWEDLAFLENELGGVLRCIEFIYKSVGVNRPLRANEDHPQDNLNKTYYRDQVNKVANSIKEIIAGLKNFGKPVHPIPQKERNLRYSELNNEGKSIAILPFQDMSPKKDQAYFCDGMTEEIINSLSQSSNLKVIARTSSFAFKDKYEDIREIGRKLDVETLLEGSLRKVGNRLRITAQLVRATDGSHLWSERYDCKMKDVFAIQDEISRAIVGNMRIKLLGEGNDGTVRHHTENLEAYSLYLKGRYYSEMMTSDGFKKALEQFEQSLSVDPLNALTYTGMATVYWYKTYWENVPPGDLYPKAKEYAEKALEIDINLAEAHSLLGGINMNYFWNWELAESYFKEALQLNPNSALCHFYYSMLLTFTGRKEEAISEVKQAQKLDPLSGHINGLGSFVFYSAGHFDEASDIARMTITMNPNYFYPHHVLGMVYSAKSMNMEAVPEFERALELSGGSPFLMAELADCYSEMGKKDETDKIYAELKKRSEQEYVSPMCFYEIHKSMGELDLAYEWLERACNEHDSYLIWANISPIERYRIPDQPRFRTLMKKAGLEK